MQKSLSIFSLAVLLLFAMGCDKIDIDHTHKPFSPSGGNKTVLVKDFTGARCVNCPGAAETVHELQHTLGEDRIFVLSVHAGYLATPVGSFPDFTTVEGTTWYGENNSNPLFAVDHVALTDGNTLYVEQIDAPLSEALDQSQTFEVQIYNEFDATTRKLHTESDVVAVSDIAGNLYVTVCLVEDSIVGWQTVPGGVNKEYVFRNVFRGTLNGADGDVFANGQTYVNDEYVYKYDMDIDSTFNVGQCYILTYVYDKKDGKILQTAMKKVK